MFTGLIERTGTISALAPIEGGYRLTVATDLGPELGDGDSIAVNGACLTPCASNCDCAAGEVCDEGYCQLAVTP